MVSMVSYRCTLCHKIYHSSSHFFTCPSCGEKGILDIIYDYGHIKKIINKQTLAANHDYSMWRYGPLIPVEHRLTKAMLRIGWTPLYEARRLHQHLGIKQLFIKDEGLNPSGSTKDRASGVAVLKALEMGATTVCCSSTGNAASSLACHAAHMGLQSVIFVPKRAPIGKLTQMSLYGANVIVVDGDYKAAYALSKQAIAKHGFYNRNAAINPFLVEGKKTVVMEIVEQLNFKPTDWMAISVGDGCSLAGVYQALYDFQQLGLIEQIPKILGVQSSGCAPFVKAFITGQDLIETDENTLADSIAVGIPRNPIKAMRAIKQSQGHFIEVSDEAILQAMSDLGHMEGIFGEPAGVAALAGIQKAVSQGIIKKSESVTFIMTGNGLKDPVNAQKTGKKSIIVPNDIGAVTKHLIENGVIKS